MAMPANLDLDTLRTLSVVHDLGSLARAAERLGRTPSAISLQMKRLQDDLGTALLCKRGRGLALTETGEVALSYARRILALHDEFLDTMQGANLAGDLRIGCVPDFAPMLPSVLSRFTSLYPRMQIELLIEGNSALVEAVDKSRIDLAAVIGHQDRATAQIAGEIDLVWIAASEFAPPKGHPLPLAMLGPKCIFRKWAIEHLEAASIPYRVAANSPSLDGLWAALLGGLGITARAALNLPEGLVSAPSLYGLPKLGRLPVTLHRNPRSRSVATGRMGSLLMEALGLMLSLTQKRRLSVIRSRTPGELPAVAEKHKQRSPVG